MRYSRIDHYLVKLHIRIHVCYTLSLIPIPIPTDHKTHTHTLEEIYGYPDPCWGSGYLVGRGPGSLKNTHGLPMSNTICQRHLISKRDPGRPNADGNLIFISIAGRPNIKGNLTFILQSGRASIKENLIFISHAGHPYIKGNLNLSQSPGIRFTHA